MSANAVDTIEGVRRAPGAGVARREARGSMAAPISPVGRDASAADGSTFAPGLALLPPELKRDVERFYRVLRTLDDLVDDDDPRAEARVAAVERWAIGQAASSPEARALEELEARRPLPRRHLLDFCAGMRHDLARGVVENDEDFDRYCHQAGGSVGIVLAHLLGAEGIDVERASHVAAALSATEPTAAAAEVGTAGELSPAAELSPAEDGMETLGRAMQVTNIARDIDEDRAHGRLYVPASLIERHGSPAPGAREELLRELIARADALYEQGQRAIPLLKDGRAAMGLASALYREILREIEREGFGRDEGRAIVPEWRKRQLIAVHRGAVDGKIGEK